AVAILRGQASVAAPYQMEARSVADQLKTVRERLVPLFINETVSALENQLAQDASTIDLALVFGAGWPRHRGGPLRYAEQVGVSQVESELLSLEQEVGPRYGPCSLLRQRAQDGGSFYVSD